MVAAGVEWRGKKWRIPLEGRGISDEGRNEWCQQLPGSYLAVTNMKWDFISATFIYKVIRILPWQSDEITHMLAPRNIQENVNARNIAHL
jgi:hypothetical protein